MNHTISDDLEWPLRSLTYCKPSQMQFNYLCSCTAVDKNFNWHSTSCGTSVTDEPQDLWHWHLVHCKLVFIINYLIDWIGAFCTLVARPAYLCTNLHSSFISKKHQVCRAVRWLIFGQPFVKQFTLWLTVPYIQSYFGTWAFCIVSPTVWNSLPADIQSRLPQATSNQD